MKCLVVRCPLTASARGLCPPHDEYFSRVLADDRYRTEPVPPSPLIIGDKVQGVLL